MTNLTLYKATELSRLENFVDEETGEIDITAFHASQIALTEKQRAVVAFVKNRDALIGMLKTAEADLAAKRKRIETQQSNLKSYLLENMKATDTFEISSGDGTFTARLYLDRDESVVIEDGAVFPIELCNAPKPPEPSKTKIKELILKGEPVAGASIVRKDRLEIK